MTLPEETTEDHDAEDLRSHLTDLAQVLSDDQRALLALSFAGTPVAVIAAHYGVHRTSIHRRLTTITRQLRSLVQARWLDAPRDHPDALVRDYYATLSPSEVGRRHGMSRHAVLRRLRVASQCDPHLACLLASARDRRITSR